MSCTVSELPTALVDNTVRCVTHPRHCKEFITRLCPRFSSLPDVKVPIHTARDDKFDGENQEETDQTASSSSGYHEEANDNMTHESMNLFLDRDAEHEDGGCMSLEAVFILLRTEGWLRALNVLKDRYFSNTWSIFIIDLIVRTSIGIQRVTECFLWWWSIERKNQQESLSIRKLSRRKNWTNLKIKLLKWHPTILWSDQYALAVVTAEDIVLVYFSGRNDPTVLNGLNEGSNSVFCMDWKPYSLTLILGCRDGLHVFTVSPKSRFPTSHRMVTRSGVSCITDLSISPRSPHLVSVSILTSTLVVWDLTNFEPVKLYKYFFAPSYLVRWSPSGLYIAVGTSGVSFKFYNMQDSCCNKWSVPRGYVTHLVWSPDDRFVLFTSSSNACIHFIEYASVTGIEDKRAAALVDTSRMIEGLHSDSQTSDIHTARSNIIQSLALDPQGRFLAVSFHQAPVIGLYKLSIGMSVEVWAQHRLDIWPAFGPLACMDFLPTGNQDGLEAPTVLTFAWNCGVLQHFAIV